MISLLGAGFTPVNNTHTHTHVGRNERGPRKINRNKSANDRQREVLQPIDDDVVFVGGSRKRPEPGVQAGFWETFGEAGGEFYVWRLDDVMFVVQKRKACLFGGFLCLDLGAWTETEATYWPTSKWLLLRASISPTFNFCFY